MVNRRRAPERERRAGEGEGDGEGLGARATTRRSGAPPSEDRDGRRYVDRALPLAHASRALDSGRRRGGRRARARLPPLHANAAATTRSTRSFPDEGEDEPSRSRSAVASRSLETRGDASVPRGRRRGGEFESSPGDGDGDGCACAHPRGSRGTLGRRRVDGRRRGSSGARPRVSGGGTRAGLTVSDRLRCGDHATRRARVIRTRWRVRASPSHARARRTAGRRRRRAVSGRVAQAKDRASARERGRRGAYRAGWTSSRRARNRNASASRSRASAARLRDRATPRRARRARHLQALHRGGGTARARSRARPRSPARSRRRRSPATTSCDHPPSADGLRASRRHDVVAARGPRRRWSRAAAIRSASSESDARALVKRAESACALLAPSVGPSAGE